MTTTQTTVNGYMLHEDGWWWPVDSNEKDWAYSLKKTNSLEFVCKLAENGVIRSRSVIQAGGAYGVWPKRLAKTFDMVISYEPDQRAFMGLTLNCPEENIVKLNAAAGHKRRPVTLQRKGFASHFVLGTSTAGNAIQYPIDNLEILNCDALILDVEGYEYYAIEGAKQTIKMCRPVILIEDRRLQEKFHGLKDGCAEEAILKHKYRLIHEAGHDKIFLPNEIKWEIGK